MHVSLLSTMVTKILPKIFWPIFQKFREGGLVGGGKHGPIWQKRVSPSFIGVFAPKTENRVFSMKTDIFTGFGRQQVTVKIRVWEECPQVLAGKARKNAKWDRLCPYTRGPSRGGCCAICCKLRRQICTNLLVFCFVHHTKGAQNCRKFAANSKLNFGHFHANTPFPMPPSRNSDKMVKIMPGELPEKIAH